MSYPVNLEIWSAFQTTLLTQAKRLCDDIARTYSKDPKDLWSSVKSNISIGLMDIEVDEDIPKYCDFPLGTTDGAVRTRCRAPCILGFPSCSNHMHKQPPPISTDLHPVDRIFDHCLRPYFVDSNGITRDKNGCVKGVFKDDCLYLFEKAPIKQEDN
jgi:hypothetical protein